MYFQRSMTLIGLTLTTRTFPRAPAKLRSKSNILQEVTKKSQKMKESFARQKVPGTEMPTMK
jgi:hypothetical protein